MHPDDERYTHLIGKDVIVPVVERARAGDRRRARRSRFGTGALKITPGHDPMDFEIGRDHGLPELTVIGLDGRMTGDVPDELRGPDRGRGGRARRQWLKEHDQLEKREHYRHAVGHCERSETRIQPLVSLQWWCDMEPTGGAGDRRDRVGPRHVPSAGRSTASRSTG